MSSLFLVPLPGSIVFHASKVRACSATSFRKSSRAILSEDGLWREGILEASWNYFFEVWITICGRKRSWCVCGFLFFFFFLESDLWGWEDVWKDFRDRFRGVEEIVRTWLWNVEVEDYRVWKFLWVFFLRGEDDSWMQRRCPEKCFRDLFQDVDWKLRLWIFEGIENPYAVFFWKIIYEGWETEIR